MLNANALRRLTASLVTHIWCFSGVSVFIFGICLLVSAGEGGGDVEDKKNAND